jgi:hypothetical protein
MYALQIQRGPFSTSAYFAHLNDSVSTSNMTCHIGRRAAAAVERRSLVLNNDASNLNWCRVMHAEHPLLTVDASIR